MSMPISIPVRQKRPGTDHILGGYRRGLLACGGGVLLLLSVLQLSRAEPAKAQTITSVCMDGAYAYFDAARQAEGSGSDSDDMDGVLDGVGEELIHCLDDMLPFPDPYQWRTSPQGRMRFEIFYTDLLSV
jgi:hypothetical protein